MEKIALSLSQTLFSFRGETSYPYLSGYTWVSFCNWKMLNIDYGSGPVRFNAEDVKAGDVVFVDYNCLGDFARRILPRIQAEIILVTSNYGYGADHPMPGPFECILEDPKVIAWFVQNIDRYVDEGRNCSTQKKNHSKKLFPIPIGIANKCWPHGNTDLLNEFIPIGLCKKKKPILCYVNYTVLPNRVECTRHFQKIGAHFAKHLTFADYLRDLSESIFVVSPPGVGMDCHRTWEALLMGCYPIVLSSELKALYEGLPIVVVQDWEEATQDFLKEKYQEFKAQNWCRDKLYAPFWFQKIKEMQQQILFRRC